MEYITINNLRCNIGQRKVGVESGGDYLLKLLDSESNSKKINVNKFEFSNNQDYLIAYNHLKQSNNFCINLGGDHSIGAVTVQSQLDKYVDDLLVIWIDAHADINTWDTSVSKNTHGMPVAPLVGLMEHWWDSSNSHHKLNPSNLVYVGIRDLDPPEVNFINQLKIPNFPNFSSDVINWIQSHPAKKIHISCDIDGIDPEFMPSTGTLANNGLKVDEVNQIINISKDKLVSFDLVELNPLIGSEPDIQKTLSNCKNILDSVIENCVIGI
jgi:arginase